MLYKFILRLSENVCPEIVQCLESYSKLNLTLKLKLRNTVWVSLPREEKMIFDISKMHFLQGPTSITIRIKTTRHEVTFHRY